VLGQDAPGPGEVTFLKKALRHGDVRGVKVRAGDPLLLDGAIALDRHLRARYQEHCAQDQHRADTDACQGGLGRATFGPFDGVFPCGARPGADRLVAQPVFEVLGEGARRSITAPGVLFQALKADGFEVAIHWI